MKFRNALLLALLLVGTTVGTSCSSSSDAQSFKFGNVSGVVVFDGPIILPTNGFSVPDVAVMRSYRENFRTAPPFFLSKNVLLLDMDVGRVLVDTGVFNSGNPGPSGAALLFRNLRSIGVLPASIDIILITHAHGDHIGGLTRRDNSAAFPNAIVYVGQEEHEFFSMDEVPAFPNVPAETVGKFRNFKPINIFNDGSWILTHLFFCLFFVQRVCRRHI